MPDTRTRPSPPSRRSVLQARLDPQVLRGQIDALKAYFGTLPPGGAPGRAGAGRLGAGGEDALSSVGLVGAEADPAGFYATGMVHPERYDAMVGR